jgi:hypothetical protein
MQVLRTVLIVRSPGGYKQTDVSSIKNVVFKILKNTVEKHPSDNLYAEFGVSNFENNKTNLP